VIGREPARTLPDVIDAIAAHNPSAPALISEARYLTFRDLADLSRRYAGWALREGVEPGDVVALLMPNAPDYLAIWLGIVRIGGVVALINTNLAGDGLRHSLSVVRPYLFSMDCATTCFSK
jgi:fatty-acyl-CoA synthase